MTYKTKGIVLRSIKYGETSLVVSIFTELFGVQTYMVNGVRSAKSKTSKANYFVPAAMLDLVVYHHEQKNMQRIKEFGWAVIYQSVLGDVIKNSIALYLVELLHKCLKQPEQHTDLYLFCEEVLLQLDESTAKAAANYPLFFALHLPQFLGFRMQDNYSANCAVLDLQEGCFTQNAPAHTHYLENEAAEITSQILKTMHPAELENAALSQQSRRMLLQHYHTYYALHIAEFGTIKTIAVLQEVL
jgi:DNA repair protein RecO (recombination protein O)